MIHHTFDLQPFPTSIPLGDLEIIGTIARDGQRLTISYSLLGDLSDVVVPSGSGDPHKKPASQLERKPELWKETCFELFLGVKNSPRYWEFNLSPAGYWNVYRFSDYRQDMEEETALASLPFNIQQEPDALSVALDLNLDAIAPETQPLEVAIATTIKHRSGDISYWALTHRSSKADFHHRNGFIIKL